MADEAQPWDWTPAERLLRGLWGDAVRVEVADTLRDGGRNRAARLRVHGGPVESVVAKQSVGDDERPYVAGDDGGEAPFRRFCNEVAGCTVLGDLGFGPKHLAHDVERGLFVMEDLGAGTSLADVVLKDDPAAATAAFEAYARTLGRMHAATRGRREEWDATRRALGGSGIIARDDDSKRNAEAFAALCAHLGAPAHPDLGSELEAIEASLADLSEYGAFTPSDCCPDNHFLRGETVAFFDCEFATYRHAFHDLAYLVAPFPTCWCCNRLPEGLSDRLIALYRQEFPVGDDFEATLTRATAGWTVATISWNWHGNLEDEDRTWGISTIRQRHALRIDNFLARQPDALLPGLTDTVRRLRAKLPEAEPMPVYPAFRQAAP